MFDNSNGDSSIDSLESFDKEHIIEGEEMRREYMELKRVNFLIVECLVNVHI